MRPSSLPPSSPAAARWLGIALVLAVHGLALWALMAQRLLPMPDEAVTLMVNFIAPPAPQQLAPKPAPKPPEPKPLPKPAPRQLVAEAPVLSPAEPVVPAPLPTPPVEVASPAPPLPLPQGPVALGGELSVVCPERQAPAYPAQSRRLGETGKVVLRVTLDERGKVAAANIERSSGYPRLDEAALGAVRGWRCTPARRNGQAVEATALQPFNFVLEGN
ncbi:energy transducer TonB [Azonexus sp.]|uniref:energy transducer TonB n=1 Tax=Azonexus sp. TaxID=1872668 RepID=UPI0035AE63CE